MQQQGGKLLFGTDTAVGGFGWGNPPGLNGYWEMLAWHEAGIPLATIFKAATLDNAKAFGLQNQLGTVAVGKQANLLLLDANPLRDIEAWNAIHTIVLHGKAIARDSLAANFRAVAVSELKIEPVAAGPGFTARIWYPTSDTGLQSFGVSRIRAGYQAVANGRYTDEIGKTDHQAPLIVLSHGSGGSADAMAWIGMELAKQGAIVVAADHPASSGGDAERASILELWQQPLDVSQLLDQLLDAKRHPEWAARIDAKRIAHVGFSLGGSTALMLAGAQLDLATFGHFCQQQQLTKTMDGACRAFSHFLPQFDAGHFQRSHDNYRDPRIKASIAIAPGFTETLTSASVKNLTTPVLLLVAANDQQLPPASHIAPVREILPASVTYRELAGAQHFSLLPLCKPGAVVLLAESHEEFVCQEVGNKSRAQIHLEALAAMQTFLQQQAILR